MKCFTNGQTQDWLGVKCELNCYGVLLLGDADTLCMLDVISRTLAASEWTRDHTMTVDQGHPKHTANACTFKNTSEEV